MDAKGNDMKTLIMVFLICLSGFKASAQIPFNWDTNPPRDTATVKYSVGVSQPSTTEQDAYKGAWQNVLYNFATSISTRFQGQTDITVQSEGYSSGIEDAYTVYLETASFSTSVPLSGVSETARKIQQNGTSYIAYILASMSVEDYNKAR
jgi:hypothetical protein